MNVRSIAAIAGRLLVAALILGIATIFAIQFARLIGKNLAFNAQLRSVRSDIALLRARRAAQLETIDRLSDDRGAIPEIHDRLHAVGPREAIIYLKRSGDSTAK